LAITRISFGVTILEPTKQHSKLDVVKTVWIY